MSYVVLARKYRPHRFEQMVGQDHVVKALTHALEQGRLHHAYLFTGTRGIGKTTVSRILAKSLNCTGADGRGGITSHPCGVCTACREIDADRYIDYVEMDAASNRSIDEIRELIERAAYKPTVGRFKVFMIDEAHQLTKDAFNALLKTLEEPPEYLKFVLATTDPEKMLPTVLSRCLQFNLRPMAPQTVAEHLAQVLEAEAVPADAGALRLLSRAARGSMRDALSLTDQAIAYGAGRLSEEGVRQMLGAVDRRHAERLIEALGQRDGQALLVQVDGLRQLGLSPAGTLDEMARLLQWMAMAQAAPDCLDVQDPDQAAAQALAVAWRADEIHLLYSLALQGRAELSLAPDEFAGLSMALLRFLAFAPARSADGSPVMLAPAVEVAPASPGGMRRSELLASPPPRMEVPVAAPTLPVAARAQPPAPSATVAVDLPAAWPSVPPMPVSAKASPEVASGPSRPASAGLRAGALHAPEVVLPTVAEVPLAKREVASHPAAVAVAPTEPRVRTVARPAPALEPPPWMDEAPPAEEEGHRAETQPRPVGPEQAIGASAPGRLGARRAPGEAHEGAQNACPLPATSPLLESSEVEHTPLGDRWAQEVRALSERGAVTALVRELALQSQLVTLDDAQGHWQLQTESDPLLMPGLADKLSSALSEQLGRPVRLQVLKGATVDTPARRDVEAARLRQSQAEAEILEHEGIKALLSGFGGARVVAGSMRPV
ncbi:DNA polymerase III subunit gamma/tau [Ideonella livida]|uniref:DNA polymerase III subunit gamma/tau n=1 Tax=Ideonella livida TaxID=2707176 RepID=A0A7C9TJH8_9BURK|nr:DNA polymerase III subunit gamma/tau [Ideonella livida]NDY90625.1 DNA polymerase III subunit gamma/tau [Ideonella livida]